MSSAQVVASAQLAWPSKMPPVFSHCDRFPSVQEPSGWQQAPSSGTGQVMEAHEEPAPWWAPPLTTHSSDVKRLQVGSRIEAPAKQHAPRSAPTAGTSLSATSRPRSIAGSSFEQPHGVPTATKSASPATRKNARTLAPTGRGLRVTRAPARAGDKEPSLGGATLEILDVMSPLEHSGSAAGGHTGRVSRARRDPLMLLASAPLGQLRPS